MEDVLLNIVHYMDKKIIFVDDYHIIRYLNQKAKDFYSQKGLNNLIGKSLLNFHKPETNEKIKEAVRTLEKDKELPSFQINETVIYAVRDKNKQLVGYYEMY